ncbi:MAG: bifunctional 5,10-methylenetetrahydrofolate dehydrogenase/5,10-methenyltetrahydrofolate cyclohydrolase [Candidatus Omnitrophota bacterium]|nr:MAG: bifunctional 5,10-methylenetetrahydrofolate dehydrogenase/5,10-methenyltetrahydrofolate cyclohydrolase [Candidatus Omnitrophota bacterium]
MAKVLDGKELAESIEEQLLQERLRIEKDKTKSSPKLVSMMIGENASSEMYAASQKKLCNKFGILYEPEKLEENVSKEEINQFIDKLNGDPHVTGIMVQLPLPEDIGHLDVIRRISSEKDVEALHPRHISRFLLGDYSLAPCTPAAIMELLKWRRIKLRGKEVVIIGHSDITGKPLSWMLLDEFATVTVCHIATSERKLLQKHIEGAEILISAVGAKNFKISGEWIKKDAVVIDVATKMEEGKIIGDIDFESAKKKASYITPVPGGVGPVTSIMLIKNFFELYDHMDKYKQYRPEF